MAKISRTISTVLPAYQRDRNRWRKNSKLGSGQRNRLIS
jgi:hypothetical protein